MRSLSEWQLASPGTKDAVLASRFGHNLRCSRQLSKLQDLDDVGCSVQILTCRFWLNSPVCQHGSPTSQDLNAVRSDPIP